MLYCFKTNKFQLKLNFRNNFRHHSVPQITAENLAVNHYLTRNYYNSIKQVHNIY